MNESLWWFPEEDLSRYPITVETRTLRRNRVSATINKTMPISSSRSRNYIDPSHSSFPPASKKEEEDDNATTVTSTTTASTNANTVSDLCSSPITPTRYINEADAIAHCRTQSLKSERTTQNSDSENDNELLGATTEQRLRSDAMGWREESDDENEGDDDQHSRNDGSFSSSSLSQLLLLSPDEQQQHGKGEKEETEKYENDYDEGDSEDERSKVQSDQTQTQAYLSRLENSQTALCLPTLMTCGAKSSSGAVVGQTYLEAIIDRFNNDTELASVRSFDEQNYQYGYCAGRFSPAFPFDEPNY